MIVDLAPLGSAILALLHRESRDAGWTVAAFDHPISYKARAIRCVRNGVPASAGPRMWNYAPNAMVAEELEAAAQRGSTAYVPVAER